MRMYQFSDCDSTDSEDGIRFKTDSTRHKAKNKSDRRPRHDSRRHNSRDRCHSRHRHRSPSPYYRRDHRKKDDRNRGRNPSKSRSRSPKHRSKRRDGHGPSRQQQRKDHSEQDNKQETTSNSHRNENENENQTSKFGPALPPHFVNPNASDKTEESKTLSLDNPKSDFFNLDTLQQSDVLGPPNTNSSTLETNHLNLNRDVAMMGPPCIGPVLPPELREKLAEQADEVEEGDDDDVYGPVPIDAINNSEAHLALEERALQMKIDQLNPRAPARIDREEWMTELPRVGGASSLGLGPRQFRANPRPDLSDRSSWTDTPEDKAKKLTSGKPQEEKIDLNKERELEEARRRDKEQDAVIKAHKKHKKKEKSLVELHQDKLKMKKEEGAEASTRRPFNREIDLKVNRFDDAQKKAVLKKAQLLDSRFCQGQSKFL